MRFVKYALSLMLLMASFIFTGELFIYHLDNFKASYYQASFSMEEVYQDEPEIIYDFLEAGEKESVDFFFVDEKILSDVKKEIVIYGTDTALETLQSKQIKTKEYESLFVGTTDVKLKPFAEIKDIKKMTTTYFIGDDVESFRAFKGHLIDKYYGGFPKLYSSNGELIANLSLVWGGCFLLILLMTCYESLINKKEYIVRYTLGEDIRYVLIQNIMFDILFLGGTYLVLGALLSRFSHVTFMWHLSLSLLIIFLILNASTQWMIVFYQMKKGLSKQLDGKCLLVFSYGIKAITFVVTLVLIAINLNLFMEGYDYYQQRPFFENHADYSYYQVNYRLENDLTGEMTREIIQKFHETFEEYSLMYNDLSYEDYDISFMNANTKQELINQNHEFADVLKQCQDEKVYLLIPNNIEIDSRLKDELSLSVWSYLGDEFKDLSQVEFIPYKESVKLVGINNQNYTYRSHYLKNPIILLNQTPIVHDKTANTPYYAYHVMYDISDEDVESFVLEHGLENEIVKKTNVYELYDHNLEIAKRSMKLVSLLSVFMILLEGAMIIFILKLEYSLKAMELVIKKTLGYTLFEREKTLMLLTIGLSFFSCVATIVTGYILGIKYVSYFVLVTVVLTVIEMIDVICKSKRLEKMKISSVLKGERV